MDLRHLGPPPLTNASLLQPDNRMFLAIVLIFGGAFIGSLLWHALADPDDKIDWAHRHEQKKRLRFDRRDARRWAKERERRRKADHRISLMYRPSQYKGWHRPPRIKRYRGWHRIEMEAIEGPRGEGSRRQELVG